MLIAYWMFYFHCSVLWYLSGSCKNVSWPCDIRPSNPPDVSSSMSVEWYFTWIKSHNDCVMCLRHNFFILSNPSIRELQMTPSVSLYWLTFWHFRLKSIDSDGLVRSMDCFYSILSCPLVYLRASGPICHIYPSNIASYVSYVHKWR